MRRVYEVKHLYYEKNSAKKKNSELRICGEESLGLYRSFINAYEDLSLILDQYNGLMNITMHGEDSNVKFKAEIQNSKKNKSEIQANLQDIYIIKQIVLRD